MPGSAGASEHQSEPPSRSSPAQVGLGDNGPSQAESELASLASRVVIGQIEYSDLSPEDLRQPRIIEACLKNSHAATELLCDLSADDAQQLVGYAQIFAEIKSLNVEKLSEMPCFHDDRFLVAFDQLIASQKADLYQLSVLYPLAAALAPNHAERRESTSELFLKHLISETATPSELVTKLHLYVPRELIAATSFGNELAKANLFAPCEETIKALVLANATPETVIDLISEAKLKDTELVGSISPKYVTPEFEARIVRFIQQDPGGFVRSVYSNQGLLLNERFQAELLGAIAKDISLAALLRPITLKGAEADAFKDAISSTVRAVLTSPALVERICTLLAKDFSSLKDLPVEVMEVSEIKHQARLSLNEFLRDDRSLVNEVPVARLLIGVFGKQFPDIMLLLGRPGVADGLVEDLPELIAVNPRAFHHLGFNLNGVSSAARDTYYHMLKALEEVGISGIGRFDSTPEILATRLRIASPEQRLKILNHLDNADKALRGHIEPHVNDPKLYSLNDTSSTDRSLIEQISSAECMSKLYFCEQREPFSIRELVESASCVQDPRPLCVVISAKPQTDSNNALVANENQNQNYDFYDSLTSHYQVVYFEANSLLDGVSQARVACERIQKNLSVLLIAAHGASNARSTTFSSIGERDPGLEHHVSQYGGYKFFEQLQPHTTSSTQVMYYSCSAAALGNDSPAARAHEYLKHVTIFAPDKTTAGRLILNPDGSFKGPIFDRANTVKFKSNANIGEVIAAPTSIMDSPPGGWSRLVKTHLWELWGTAGRLLVVGYLFRFLGKTFNREGQKHQEPQLPQGDERKIMTESLE